MGTEHNTCGQNGAERLVGRADLPVPPMSCNVTGERNITATQPVTYPHSPPASSPEVRRRMQRMPRRDTTPELAIRSILHRQGFRYRVHHQPLQGMRRRADIVFTARRVAVFVDGCFWHVCPIHGHVPKQNVAWWQEKIARNQRRDMAVDQALTDAGWAVCRFWAHEDPIMAAQRVTEVVRLQS